MKDKHVNICIRFGLYDILEEMYYGLDTAVILHEDSSKVSICIYSDEGTSAREQERENARKLKEIGYSEQRDPYEYSIYIDDCYKSVREFSGGVELPESVLYGLKDFREQVLYRIRRKLDSL